MKQKEVIISVQRVSKKFCKDLKRSLYYGFQDILKLGKGNTDELRKNEFWAVSDISFELRRGECLGLIGHNGAGKSTLLKMLNGLISPDKGTITIHGRVGALIELGAGFNPILTGRENIYNNGSVLGFNKAEIDIKLQEIIDFSEIEEFIDMPVQNYSSGMKVRLGFAVAANLEPDLLLVDEVLAVGDIGFKIKCFAKIAEIINKSAIIFVSHSMPQVSRVSTSVLLLDKGAEYYYSTNVDKGVEQYYSLFGTEGASEYGEGIKVLSFGLGKNRVPTAYKLSYLESLEATIEFKPELNAERLRIGLVFFDKDMKQLAVCRSQLFKVKKDMVTCAKVTLCPSYFSSGIYSITLTFNTFDEQGALDKKLTQLRNLATFQSVNVPVGASAAPFVLPSAWIEEENIENNR